MNYLGMIIEQRKLIDNMNRASMSCLAEDYKANKITPEEFEVEMRDLTRKQNKLFNGDVTIHRQRDIVLSEIGRPTGQERIYTTPCWALLNSSKDSAPKDLRPEVVSAVLASLGL